MNSSYIHTTFLMSNCLRTQLCIFIYLCENIYLRLTIVIIFKCTLMLEGRKHYLKLFTIPQGFLGS